MEDFASKSQTLPCTTPRSCLSCPPMSADHLTLIFPTRMRPGTCAVVRMATKASIAKLTSMNACLVLVNAVNVSMILPSTLVSVLQDSRVKIVVLKSTSVLCTTIRVSMEHVLTARRIISASAKKDGVERIARWL